MLDDGETEDDLHPLVKLQRRELIEEAARIRLCEAECVRLLERARTGADIEEALLLFIARATKPDVYS
jgi:hypothetical protein